MLEVVREYNRTYTDSTIVLNELSSAQYWTRTDIWSPRCVAYGSVSKDVVQDRLCEIEPDFPIIDRTFTPSPEKVHTTRTGLKVLSLECTKEQLKLFLAACSQPNRPYTARDLLKHQKELEALLDKSISLFGHQPSSPLHPRQPEWLAMLAKSVVSIQERTKYVERLEECAVKRYQFHSDLLSKLDAL